MRPGRCGHHYAPSKGPGLGPRLLIWPPLKELCQLPDFSHQGQEEVLRWVELLPILFSSKVSMEVVDVLSGGFWADAEGLTAAVPSSPSPRTMSSCISPRPRCFFVVVESTRIFHLIDALVCSVTLLKNTSIIWYFFGNFISKIFMDSPTLFSWSHWNN